MAVNEKSPRLSLRRGSKTRDIRLHVKIAAPPERIYRALTSATELCRWWLQGAETEARNAGRFRMVWPKVRVQGETNGRRFFPPYVAVGDSEGFFVDLEPKRKVAWMWKLPRRAPYPPLSSFFIEAKGRDCEVTLLHAGFFKRKSAEKYFAGCAAGWEDCLAKLKLYLETGRTCKSQPLSFRKLRALRRTS